MALTDAAVVKISTAHFYTSEVGALVPEDGIATPEHEEMGHTPLTDILNIAFDGGDVTTLGSLQNTSLRTARTPRTATVNMSILQWDAPGKKLYLGSNALTDSAGRLGPAASPAPTVKQVWIVVEDGDTFFDFVFPKVEILGTGDLSLADTENLAALPLALTPLQVDSSTAPYYIGDPKPKGTPTGG